LIGDETCITASGPSTEHIDGHIFGHVQEVFVKGLRVIVISFVTAAIMGFGLGLLSAYLEAHGERPIQQSTRLMMILGMTGMVASIAATRGANRRVSRAAATEEAEAKRCAPVADRATVYVFRDANIGKVAGLDVLLNGTAIGQTRGKTFYRLQLPPGEHLLTSRNPQDGSQHEHRLQAGAGSLVFLEQRVRFGMMTLRHDIVPAEQAKATSRIKRCRLLVSAPSAS
jgi:hypothetical protein